MWIQLNEHILCCAEVDLQEPGLVQRRIKKGKETLMGNVRARLGDFPAMFHKEMSMIITVQETVVAFLAMPEFNSLQGALLKNDNESLGGGLFKRSLGDLGSLLRLKVFHTFLCFFCCDRRLNDFQVFR